jgi:hypothetical protein
MVRFIKISLVKFDTVFSLIFFRVNYLIIANLRNFETAFSLINSVVRLDLSPKAYALNKVSVISRRNRVYSPAFCIVFISR